MSRRHRFTRIALATAGFGSIFAARSRPSEAQVAAESRPRVELAVPAGRLVPTGAQGTAIARGGVTAVQVSYVPRPTLALTSTLGWARSRDVAEASRPKLDIFLFDVGAEVRAPRWIGNKALTLSPFAGVGAGVRAYNRRSLDTVAPSAAGYASAGTEVGIRRVRLRIEARDYVSGLEPFRNDVMMMVGLRIASRR